ncbi:MAG: hypothetical protein ACRDRL_14015 [Sciscionella sp.]
MGITVAPSTVWEILKNHGIQPAPHRDHLTWAGFVRGQARALLAADFFEARTLTGTRLFVFAVIEHATRRILWGSETRCKVLTWAPRVLVGHR